MKLKLECNEAVQHRWKLRWPTVGMINGGRYNNGFITESLARLGPPWRILARRRGPGRRPLHTDACLAAATSHEKYTCTEQRNTVEIQISRKILMILQNNSPFVIVLSSDESSLLRLINNELN